MAASGQFANQQAAASAGRRRGEQVPFAGPLPRSLGIDGRVGGLGIDGDAIGRVGEDEQFRPLVPVDVVGHRIDGHFVDRHLAVRPLRGQRQLVGPIGICPVLADPLGRREPAVEIDPRLPGIDDEHVIAAVGAKVGHGEAFRTSLQRDHPKALPPVEGFRRGERRLAPRGDERQENASRNRSRAEVDHAGKDTPPSCLPP